MLKLIIAAASERNLPLPRVKPKRNRAKVAAANNGAGEPVDFGPLKNWVGFHLRMAQGASFQAFARLTQDVYIRPGRFATLLLIGRNPGISQTALSRANGRDKSTLTPVLVDLERRGLIRRVRTRNDRRTYRLSLTSAGERTLRELLKCARRHDRNLDRVIGAKDRDRFLAILRKIINEIA